MSYKHMVIGLPLASVLLALGQTAAAKDAAADTATTNNSEIIVTAERRSERLVDVPAAITALSGDLLQKSGVANTTDLAKNVAGMTMSLYGGFLQPSLRGITSTGANLGENSNVALYVDGVYQPQQVASLIDLPDVQDIEVLKGPQGALYGQNATGGAILVSSLAPSFTTKGKFSASYGNYNAVKLQGYATGAITSTIAASISGGYEVREGMRTQVITGQRDLGLNSKLVRGKLLFEPSPATKITLSGYYSDRKDSSSYSGFAINGDSVGYAADPNTPKPSKPSQYSTDPNVFSENKSYGGDLHTDLDLGAGTFTSTTSYQHNETPWYNDVDYTSVNLGISSSNPLYAHYFIHDMNFSSKKMGAVSFLVGAFYLKGTEAYNGDRFDYLTGTTIPAPAVIAATISNFNARLDKEIFAGYAEVTLRATEALTLTAGGRYSHETQRAFSENALGQPHPGVLEEYPGGPQSFNKFTPRVVARYALSPVSNVYASVSQGFKSGVVNISDFTIAPVKPESITAYEVGYKGSPVDGVHLNVAGFYYNYKNLQEVFYIPGQAYITQNAASATVKGVDFDMSWQVTPQLTLSGSGAFLDAKFKSFPQAVSFTPNATNTGPTVFGYQDMSGQTMLRSPHFSGNIAANYEVDTNFGKLSAFASLYHTSSYGMDPTNRIRQNGYETVDAELAVEPKFIPGLRMSLWGKNLTNTTYLATVVIAGSFADGGAYADPRTYGVRAQVKF